MGPTQMVQRCPKLDAKADVKSEAVAVCVLPRMHIGKCVRDRDGGVNIGWRLEKHGFEGGGIICTRCHCVVGHPVHRTLPAAA